MNSNIMNQGHIQSQRSGFTTKLFHLPYAAINTVQPNKKIMHFLVN